jgi:aminopeptidase N
LRNFARGKLGPALARLGWTAKPNEPTTDSLLRDVLIDALSSLDDRPTIDEAKRRFHAWTDNGADLPGSIRGSVLRATARGADAGEFDKLLTRAQSESDRAQQQNLLTALAGVRDPSLAQRVLDQSLADWVAPTTRSQVVVQVAQAGEHAALAWRFAQAHYADLVEPLDPTARWEFAASIVAGSSDAARADELRDFTETRIPADARQPVQRVVEEIKFRADKKTRLATAVEQWIAAHP